jgi:hypothetical protein
MTARLASSILVGALRKAAEAQGGFAAVLAKGDANAGAVLVVVEERGAEPQVMERILQPKGDYAWQSRRISSGQSDQTLQKFLADRRRYDPDLWILELSVPSIERFTADLAAFD